MSAEETGVPDRYRDAIERTRLFEGLKPEVLAGLAGQLSEVTADTGKVLTRISAIPAQPTFNRLILPDGTLYVEASSRKSGAEGSPVGLGTFQVEPGETLLDGSWTDGAETPRKPALSGPPALDLRLERSGKFFVLDPLRVLRSVIPDLDEEQVCKLLANIGSAMSHRLSDLNRVMVERREGQQETDVKVPVVGATDPALLQALLSRLGISVSKSVAPLGLHMGRPGTVSVVTEGAWLIGTGPFEEAIPDSDDQAVYKESVSGKELKALCLAELGAEPTVVFPGFAMDGENRHVGLVGKSRGTVVSEFKLPENDVAAHIGLVRVITGQSADMARWVRQNQSKESLSFVQALLAKIRGN